MYIDGVVKSPAVSSTHTVFDEMVLKQRSGRYGSTAMTLLAVLGLSACGGGGTSSTTNTSSSSSTNNTSTDTSTDSGAATDGSGDGLVGGGAVVGGALTLS